MREQFQAQIESLRQAFSRLTQREQVMVAGGGAVAVLVVLLVIGLSFSSAIRAAERRVGNYTEKLGEVLELQGQYRARKAEYERRLRELSRSRVQLVKVVEDAAKQTGVEIKQLTPKDGEPNADGIVESTVELRASNLSINRLQDFLNRLHASRGVVIVQRMRIDRPYRRDTLELDMVVVTYRVES